MQLSETASFSNFYAKYKKKEYAAEDFKFPIQTLLVQDGRASRCVYKHQLKLHGKSFLVLKRKRNQ